MPLDYVSMMARLKDHFHVEAGEMQIGMKNGMARLFFAALGILLLSSAAAAAASTVQYRYDELDRLYQVEYGDGTIVEYAYDKVGNRIAMSRPIALTLSASPPSPQADGTQVTFTGAASGGSGAAEYRFWRRSISEATWTIAQDYSTNATWNWDTTGLASGIYYIQVDARAAGSTAWSDASANTSYVISSVTGVTFDPAPPAGGSPGAPVSFTASVGGGAAEYRFWRRSVSEGTWTIAQDYSTNATWNDWDTTGLSGVYYIQVDARGVGSSSWSDASANTSYVLTSITGVAFDPAPPSGGSPGAAVSFTGLVAGGGAAEYRFWRRSASEGTWTIAQDYSTNATWNNWDTTGLSGVYYIQVDARAVGSSSWSDASANTSYVIQ
jgi:YD repeat-containing protein